MKREDGLVLSFDAGRSGAYFLGEGVSKLWHPVNVTIREYRTVRLVWRTRVPRREYASWDCLECLTLGKDVKDVRPWR